jgi:hypothetical protein
MTHKARLRWALVLGMLLLVGGSAIWILHWNSEEYAVYEATIREGFSGEDVSYYVILDTTEPVGVSVFPTSIPRDWAFRSPREAATRPKICFGFTQRKRGRGTLLGVLELGSRRIRVARARS